MIFDLSRLKSAVAAAEDGEAVSKLDTGETQVTMSKLIDLLNLKGTPKSKLSEATYFACLRILSEGVGKLPLKLMQTVAGKGVVERRDLPLYHVLRYRPNPFVTATRFWGTVETHRNHYGNAFVWLRPAGNTFRLWQLPSPQVQIWWDNKHILADQEHLWYIWSAPDGKRYPLCDDEVLHFRTWLSLDGITGLAVRDILRLTVEGAQKSQTMLNALYDNGFTAKAVVQYTGDLNDKSERAFLQNIENYARGKVNGGNSIIPIPLGTKLEPLDIKLTDGQFLELRKYTALQVAAAFGVAPNFINDYEKASYASAEAQQLSFLTNTLLYILKDYEEEITAKLVPDRARADGVTAKFNTAVILRADTKTQVESMAKAVSNSIYTPNEARRFLDLSDQPGGDRLYANGNLIPIELAGTQYAGRKE